MNTLDDVGARQAEVLRELRASCYGHAINYDDPRSMDRVRALDAAIAALSALPAAGGGCGDHDHANYIPGCPKCALTLPEKHTAPQPSAAEGAVPSWLNTELTVLDVGLGFALCNMDHAGTRRDVKKAQDQVAEIRRRLVTPSDADVGAQGDGRLYTQADLNAEYTRGRCDGFDAAAPAAGKGVDDAMRQCAQGLIEQLPGDHDGRNSWMLNYGVGEESDWLRAEHARYSQAWKDWRAGYPQPERKPNPFRNATESGDAALTRQPVAGDGMVLVPREPTQAIRGVLYRTRSGFGDDYMTPEQATALWSDLLAAAPTGPAQGDGTDTPTDGGEGKS